jgi:hypothetical protein
MLPVVTVSAFLWVGNSGRAVAGTTGDTTACTNETLKGGYGTIGTGAGVGMDVGAVTTMVFDGAGKMAGHGTAVFDRPAAGFRFEIRNATYSLNKDCTGTMSWYAHFPDIEQGDHSHTADIVVTDGGKQFMFIYTSTTFQAGGPTGPYVGLTAWGRRM